MPHNMRLKSSLKKVAHHVNKMRQAARLRSAATKSFFQQADEETAAVACMDTWHARIPALQAQLGAVRDALWKALPNVDAEGKPLSGSYWCETDYDDREFQRSHWGAETYAKLLAIKDKYDPAGLFVCHHCVGSERWTKESNLNCRAKEA